MARGKSDAPPLPSSSGCLNCTDTRVWRESMLCAVRGMIVTDDAIRMFAFGGRCRHGQDLCGAYSEGGDGAIVPVTIRRGKCSRSRCVFFEASDEAAADGFASIGSVSSSWNEPGVFTTKPVAVTGKTLLLNAASSNGGGVRVAVAPEAGHSTGNRTLEECLTVGSDVLSAPVVWSGHGSAGSDLSDLVGSKVKLTFELKSAQLFSFRFE